MTRRLLGAHGADSAWLAWAGCLVVSAALRTSSVPLDAFFGGPPRVVRGPDTAVLLLAVVLPSLLHPRCASWERVNPTIALRAAKVALAMSAATAPVVLAWIDYAFLVEGPGLRMLACRALVLAACASVACITLGPALGPVTCLALLGASVAVEQHWPGVLEALVQVPVALALVGGASVTTAITLGQTRWSANRSRNAA